MTLDDLDFDVLKFEFSRDFAFGSQQRLNECLYCHDDIVAYIECEGVPPLGSIKQGWGRKFKLFSS